MSTPQQAPNWLDATATALRRFDQPQDAPVNVVVDLREQRLHVRRRNVVLQQCAGKLRLRLLYEMQALDALLVRELLDERHTLARQGGERFVQGEHANHRSAPVHDGDMPKLATAHQGDRLEKVVVGPRHDDR